MEIRNGRDYINLLQKHGIQNAVRSDESKDLCRKLGASQRTSEIIQSILTELEEDLQKLDEEASKTNVK